ncbi:sensor histidine kinase [Actomonas aquatica]|uniref:histidine kinase n=1 Tax=Actomonas aquatica TaxID=2866162 RepID=A0ABZ1C1V7_9BACT|nr:response regulator [Opitutus sp. WL0086]WRQ85604.1 response regulator [Opitutus sp. WL0086]
MTQTTESRLILLVEDHENFRAMVVEVLSEAGYRVIPASSGQAGLALALDHNPDLIITDLRMPGMSGFEFIEELKRRRRFATTPVIVLTALSTPSDTRLAMNAGADDYITKPVNAADLLRSVSARLEKRDLIEELDAFAHTVAHDLRSPIAMALGRLELAAMRLGENDLTRLGENLTEAQASVRRLGDIVDEMLLLANVRRSTVRFAPLDMHEIVTEAVQRAGNYLRTAKAELTVPDTWPTAFGYAPWIIHVWFNLITNAAKYGGNPPRIELSSETPNNGGCIRFIVRDFGPGLKASSAANTFTPFAKIPQQRGKGHGLGLSIVRQIMTKLNGSCGVQSASGEGAAFWFELPPAPAEDAVVNA